MKKLILWESSCFSISPKFFVVWLILLAAKRNWLAVNRIFSGRRFAGCLSFFRVGQGGVLEKLTYRRSTCGGGSSQVYKRMSCKTEDQCNEYLREISTPILTGIDRDSCDGKLTMKECFKALIAMPPDESPGNDGLSRELHITFFDDLRWFTFLPR